MKSIIAFLIVQKAGGGLGAQGTGYRYVSGLKFGIEVQGSKSWQMYCRIGPACF